MKQIFTMDVERDINAGAACASLLTKNGIRGEFYICGYLVEKHPDTCRQIAKHHVVGGHGYYHENFARLPLTSQKRIIQKTAAIFAANGMHMEGWRFPMVQFTNRSLSILAKLGIYDSSFNRKVWDTWGRLVFVRNWLGNVKRGQFFLPFFIPRTLIEKPWNYVDLDDPGFYKKNGRLMMHCYRYETYARELQEWLSKQREENAQV